MCIMFHVTYVHVYLHVYTLLLCVPYAAISSLLVVF